VDFGVQDHTPSLVKWFVGVLFHLVLLSMALGLHGVLVMFRVVLVRKDVFVLTLLQKMEGKNV
jgi:hypothetical protein